MGEAGLGTLSVGCRYARRCRVNLCEDRARDFGAGKRTWNHVLVLSILAASGGNAHPCQLKVALFVA